MELLLPTFMRKVWTQAGLDFSRVAVLDLSELDFFVGRIPNRHAESFDVAVLVFMRRISTDLMRDHMTSVMQRASTCPSRSRSRPL